ncbi:Hypothetical predicted protein [Paramuricea clavata]|uniref:Uncharacterized protein n=1 Tax=Paramuricea clavata TaxID=317549 RepID=A0A6S7IJK6_PARCT|nr:Hypothetical predicted protein [Paramuricea clavata]
MTSTLSGQKRSKVPIPIPNTNASTVREDISSAQAKKPPYETRKSAEELKLRLASAVSAKIALGRDGRNPSSNSSNRGIGFLLQRKEQQENRLNTKDISFQKPARNHGGKPVEMMAKNTTKSVNKAELQKSLLSALMNSRGTSAASSGQNRSKDTRGKLNSDTKGKTSTNEYNKTPISAPKATSNVANKSSNGGISGQNRDSRFANGSLKLNPSAPNKGKMTASEFNSKPLSTVNPRSGDLPSKSPLESSNGTRGGILDRAKNIERLLGQRKRENIPVESTNATKDDAVNGKEKTTQANKGITNVNGKSIGDTKLDKNTGTAAKSVETDGKKGTPILNGRNNRDINTTKLLASLNKEGDSFLNGRTNGVFKLNKTPKTTQPVGYTGKEKIESSNGENSGKFGVNESVETRKPFESFGKKIPPPVAKKPSKEDMHRLKQTSSSVDSDRQNSVTLANGNVSSNGKISSQNDTRSTSKINSPQTQGKTGALKVNSLRSKNETALLLNGTNSGKDVAFREDLLEKLEADIGSCKIAAFQSLEDFSALRMKVYRIRGELDQLKREREKRTPLVC